MVATRRMVQQDPTEDELAPSDPDVMLKKKPVRKATAKAAEKTATIGKGRGTRGKKADIALVEPEQDEEAEVVEPVKATKKAVGRPKKEDAPLEDEKPQPAKAARGAKAGSVRGKKAIAAVEEEPTVDPVEEPKPTRTTKAASVRGKKSDVLMEDEVAEPAAEVPKPTKTTKGGSVRGKKGAAAVEAAPTLSAPETKPTRGTRATATKAQPLSPKKITQVSKPATRTTRNANQKPAAQEAAAKAPAKGGRTTRKRTVSDENAEVPDLNQDLDDNEDIVMLSSTPVKNKSTRAQAKKQQEKAESEASMSSRPTTPNDSTLQSFAKDESHQGEEMDDAEPVSDDELALNEAEADRDASLDELCGPKTPMKRGSPGAEARYLSSVQRTIRKYEDSAQGRVQTPARRFAVLGSQRGTPQTLKPYCKPIPPPSAEARPMTVSRAAGRAFVFRDLAEGAPALPEKEEVAELDEEASFVVDDDIIPVDSHDDLLEAQPSITATPTPAVEPLQLQSPPASISEADETEEDEDIVMSHPIEDEENFIAPAEIEQDPEETMLADDADTDMEEPYVTSVQPAESFETEDTVIITRAAHESEEDAMLDSTIDEDVSDDKSVIVHDIRSPPATTEAMEWQPRKQDATITVNFDELFTGARSAAEDALIEPTFDEEVSEIAHQTEEDQAVAGAEMDLEPEPVTLEQPSRRQTMNLNDFIDVAALSEPTEALNLAAFAEQAGDGEMGLEMGLSNTGNGEADLFTETDDRDMFDEDEHREEPAEEPAQEQSDALPIQAENMPHYAFSTIAYDARRKSLPALMHRTPTKTATRPHTSDGSSMPRIANPFANASWSKSRALSTTTTPVKARPSTARGLATLQSPAKTPVATPKERFPRLAPRQDYVEHARTVAAPRFKDPVEKSTRRRETFHRGASGRVSESTPKAAESASTPKALGAMPSTPLEAETPTATPGERYPRLRPRPDYSEHAKTVAGPVRFHTPVKTPLKRPATAQKPDALRKAALKASTPMASRSPTKTPLKAAAMTPGQEPLTPHPAAPLRGIVALVEVFTLEGASASSPFIALLHRLGAKTTKAWGDRVTHVVFKDGSPTTLQRVRLHNKDVEEKGSGSLIHCINSRWVTDCDTEGARMDESDEAYTVDVAEIPRGGKRRRKSMEPSALLNIGGNIVRDRKSSAGRIPSFGRSPLKFVVESPAKKIDEVPEGTPVGKENSGDEASSPVTPAWIADPGHLVQQTAPMNRVRKLDLPGKEAAKSRRLTFWNGGA